uniref:hypothetical protein n=1 Tax=Catenella fusiformis TaxID=3024791 RepID=UPI0027DAA5E6|nr:hypothetical protein REQ04_pgp084 [Catenella fusiformis]WCH57543.1 hypothetical protein [Catenella fusiformis]
MSIPKKLCPVPYDQQPLNEYVALKKSCFFAWSMLSKHQYVSTICAIFVCLSILFAPFIWIVFYIKTNWLKKVLLNILIVTLVCILIFLRLYLGWSYVTKRLVSATVFYEESGWYDGQVWIKTVDSLTKDRLIGLYEVNPFIIRIKYTLLSFILLLIVESIMFYLL